MRQTSKIILATIVAASILLGLGYAAIQNITLNITGTAAADPSQSNFKVRFIHNPAPTVTDSTFAIASITDDYNATLNVSGLTAKGQSVSATYTIENASADLSADLAISTTNTNTEYFKISSQLAKTSLIAGEKTTVTVTVELTKTPLESVSSTIGVQMLAIAVQPGEEGSSGLTNDFSQTPEDTKMISFIISRTTYQAEEGMTWDEWLDSEYNTDGFIWVNQFQSVTTAEHIKVFAPEGGQFWYYRQIQNGEIYVIQGETPKGREIVFYVEGSELNGEDNMTWNDYINSEYNIDEYGNQRFYVSLDGYVGISTTRDGVLDIKFTDDSGPIRSTDKLKENYNYGLQYN